MNAMKNAVFLLIGLALAARGASSADRPLPDFVAEHLYPLELIQQHHEALAVTEEQRAFFLEEVRKTEERVSGLQARLRAEADALTGLLKKEQPDEAAALAQAEKLHTLDGEIKKAQLGLLLRIKARLTPTQQATLNAFKARGPVIKEKLARAMGIARRWREEGRDLSRLEALKGEMESALREGRVKEAEVVLDRALQILEGKETPQRVK